MSTMDRPAIRLRPGINLCQSDLPLGWYQDEMRPYAEEYLALPDRTPETVLPWLDRYMRPAIDHFGDDLLLLAHYYMGGEIVKLVERYGGAIGDSYALATRAAGMPEKKIIVQSAVHFMAEAVAIMARPDQSVWITNPSAGCTMEMMATEDMVLPVAEQFLARYGDDLRIVAYMNTSGRIKALAGRTGGAACTSSNAHLVVEWARRGGRKVFFVPDRHLGANVADRLGIADDRTATLPTPAGRAAPVDIERWEHFDRAELILWGSYCGVHTVFRPEHVGYWRARGWQIAVHPEAPREVVLEADLVGSTADLWKAVMAAPPGSKFAIGTEGHFVRNLREQAALQDVEVVHLAAAPDPRLLRVAGCGCATMSRNDPPHLAGLLDLLRKGAAPEANRVHAGDVIDEHTGQRDRLPPDEQAQLACDARAAMQRMIDITEAAAAKPENSHA